MEVSFNDILFAFSTALDCVERELIGVTTGHGKRVACIAVQLGKQLGLQNEQLLDLAACAVLHDCALSEYLATEWNVGTQVDLAVHCHIGQKYIGQLPFAGDVTDAILYHHENADGSGALGKRAEETPLFAQLIHFADTLDVSCNLRRYDTDKYQKICTYLTTHEGTVFIPQQVECFLDTIKTEQLEMLSNGGEQEFIRQAMPRRMITHAQQTLRAIAAMFAKITDYKSPFTRRHSIDIAQKAYQMAQYYGYDAETCEKLYFAGAVHDIGKLVVSNEVLEKPDKLNDIEYRYIQTHAAQSYAMLKQIEGMEDITHWACFHHEKLDGSGYPFGYTAEKLDKNDRLLACLDIYQALTEPRPYKDGMPHEKAMQILKQMADKKQLDAQIIMDIDTVFAKEAAVS